MSDSFSVLVSASASALASASASASASALALALALASASDFTHTLGTNVDAALDSTMDMETISDIDTNSEFCSSDSFDFDSHSTMFDEISIIDDSIDNNLINHYRDMESLEDLIVPYIEKKIYKEINHTLNNSNNGYCY
jgi:tRNA A37 threonylcarbamoyladenosine synthetase subunit TsaC/SUA5/YrdC